MEAADDDSGFASCDEDEEEKGEEIKGTGEGEMFADFFKGLKKVKNPEDRSKKH